MNDRIESEIRNMVPDFFTAFTTVKTAEEKAEAIAAARERIRNLVVKARGDAMVEHSWIK
jgi:hypothetical protein